MNFPRRHGKALENLVSPPQNKLASVNEGLIKVRKTDGTTLYGLWQRNTFANEPVSLIFISEPGSIPLASLDADPSIHSYTTYQLRNLELQRPFQKSIIDRHLKRDGSLASLLEPLVYSGRYTGDSYLRLIAYLAILKPINTIMTPQSLSDNSEDYAKVTDKNLEAIEKLLSGGNCGVKVKPQVANDELEEIMFEQVRL